MGTLKVYLIGILILVTLTIGVDFACAAWSRGKLIESWETSNGTIKVRVKAYLQKGVFLEPGAYYVFESTVGQPEAWHEIMIFRHDDPVAIPRNQIRFVNPTTGYIFMGWMYAVTVDGGKTWSVWTAKRDLPGWKCCNYRLIDDVTITAEGSGVMRLNPIPHRSGEVPELRTRNFGRHWTAE